MTGKPAEMLWATFLLNFSLYCAGDRLINSRRLRWVWHVARMRERRGVYRVLVGKPEGKRPLGRSRHRLEDNIQMHVQEVGYGVWTGWSWLRIGTSVGHL